MVPSKCVVVHAWMRSGEPFIFCFEKKFHVSKEKGTSVTFLTVCVVVANYLHDLFAVGTTIAPKVYWRLNDGAEQTGA
jgi:hypothetical protein